MGGAGRMSEVGSSGDKEAFQGIRRGWIQPDLASQNICQFIAVLMFSHCVFVWVKHQG